jgi:pyruvate dehydrogenase E1 component beta subunit
MENLNEKIVDLSSDSIAEYNIKSSVYVRDALRHAMYEEMIRDDKVFIMGEEVAEYRGAYKVTGDLFEIFNTPESTHIDHKTNLDPHMKDDVELKKSYVMQRVIDTPITEHGFTGIGIGAAFAGLRPIVEFMTFNFALQAIDQIINSAAKTKYMSGGQVCCPIVFRGPNGVASGVGAQHSQSFGSLYAHIPGLKVIAPYFAEDCRGLLKTAIRNNDPVIFLENELVYGEEHQVSDAYFNKSFFDYMALQKENKGKTIPQKYLNNPSFHEDFIYAIGKARIVKESNINSEKKVTLIGYSRMMKLIIEAENILSENNIDVEIIDLRTLRPLDENAIIQSVKKNNLVVVVDEEWPQYSVASEIIALINDKCFDDLDGPVVRINAVDVPLPYAKNLEALALPTVAQIVGKVTKLVNKEI